MQIIARGETKWEFVAIVVVLAIVSGAGMILMVNDLEVTFSVLALTSL